jgi:murein tripeptide amidase MpaA
MAINKKALAARLERLEKAAPAAEFTCKESLYVAFIKACPIGKHVHDWAEETYGITREQFHALKWQHELPAEQRSIVTKGSKHMVHSP